MQLRIVLQAVQHLETAPAARALDVVDRVGDLLQLQQHKPRHDDDAFDQPRFDEIRDAAVDDDARVQQHQVVRLVLPREAHIRDDEGEILLVAAHRQHDADVTEAEE